MDVVASVGVDPDVQVPVRVVLGRPVLVVVVVVVGEIAVDTSVDHRDPVARIAFLVARRVVRQRDNLRVTPSPC